MKFMRCKLRHKIINGININTLQRYFFFSFSLIKAWPKQRVVPRMLEINHNTSATAVSAKPKSFVEFYAEPMYVAFTYAYMVFIFWFDAGGIALNRIRDVVPIYFTCLQHTVWTQMSAKHRRRKRQQQLPLQTNWLVIPFWFFVVVFVAVCRHRQR